jgi:hypothetical protein
LGGGTVEFGCITNILVLLAVSIFKMERLTSPWVLLVHVMNIPLCVSSIGQ